ncbi:MAG: rRNA maturation RNase YbeY [Pseudomonadales bacterium]|nr:rRNA maturation RNase YbeY [Pseudomonadales bacterium]
MTNKNIVVQYAHFEVEPFESDSLECDRVNTSRQVNSGQNDVCFVPEKSVFEHWISTTLAQIAETGSVCLRIVGRDEMLALNGRYRGKYTATNVLSFPANPAEVEVSPALDAILGDIAICADIVCAQAGEQNKPEVNHWAHMTVHGVLHLAGYDHQTDGETKNMEALEVEILKSFNFPDPYYE